MADVLTPEQRSRCMSKVKSRDTGPERAVRSALHRRGLRFRKHVEGLPGRPDIVFTRRKVAVFVDGDFWHGYEFESRAGKLSPHWRAKIARNMARDRENGKLLQGAGWRVVRVWEHEVRRDLEGCLARIVSALSSPRGP
jgi:DNA mismatch endonuclease (patch repair protein)